MAEFTDTFIIKYFNRKFNDNKFPTYFHVTLASFFIFHAIKRNDKNNISLGDMRRKIRASEFNVYPSCRLYLPDNYVFCLQGVQEILAEQ